MAHSGHVSSHVALQRNTLLCFQHQIQAALIGHSGTAPSPKRVPHVHYHHPTFRTPLTKIIILIVPDYGVGRNSLSEAEINRFCNQLSWYE